MEHHRAEHGASEILTVVNEYTRENLCLHVARDITAVDVIDQLAALIKERGAPDHNRSDNGTEFIAFELRTWLISVGTSTLFIEPGGPWRNAYIESFDGKLRDELLNQEIFPTLVEARYLADPWRSEYNQFRPHSSLGNKPPPGGGVQSDLHDPFDPGGQLQQSEATAGPQALPRVPSS